MLKVFSTGSLVKDFQLAYKMDLDIYSAAAKGEIAIFKERVVRDQLNGLLTPRKNTILHIHIAAQTRENGKDESTQFIQQILDLCPSLLLQPNTKGETLLHMAARHGLVATVKALLQCAKNSHHDCNNHEIESGLDVATQMVRKITISKDTALHEAVRHHHTGVVQILIREDPDFPYSANEAGETPLYLAAERGYHDAVSEILETCMSIAHGGPNGRTSLHAAVIFNDEVITQKLLDRNSCLTSEADHKGWTPLHYAAYFGHLSVLKQLLYYDQYAAYIGDKDENMTALHIAASQGHVHVMNELLSCCPGCCELVDHKGRNVTHFALESINGEQTVKFIVENSSLCNLINETDSAMMASKIKKLRTPDIFLANAKFLGLKRYTKELMEEEGGESTIPNDSAKVKGENLLEENESKEEEARNKSKEARKMSVPYISRTTRDTHLVVATLITTVTFTAGFTVPGGSNTEGAPILIRTNAFQAFIITNTLAMVFSSSSVASHLFMGRQRKDNLVDDDMFNLMLAYTTLSMLLMGIAFVAGTYAVLQHSLAFAIAICGIGCLYLFLLVCVRMYIEGP